MKEKYIVKKDERVVVCVLYNCLYDPQFAFEKHAGGYILPHSYPKFSIKEKYKGVAKCAPDDEWDEAIGKRIAYERAFREYKRDFNCAFERCVRCVESCLSNAKNWHARHYG